MLLTQKLWDPKAGSMASHEVTLYHASKLDPRSDNPASFRDQPTTLEGRVRSCKRDFSN